MTVLILLILGLLCVTALLAKVNKANKPKHKNMVSRIPIKKSTTFISSSDVQNGIYEPYTPAQVEAKRLITMLLDIYTPKIPFRLRVSNKKPKTRMGVYCSNGNKIIVYEGWNCSNRPEETAIHELAHHIHLAENKGRSRKERPHGKEFKKIYNDLISTAKQKGYKV